MTAVAATPYWPATDQYDSSVWRARSLAERADTAYTVKKRGPGPLPGPWISTAISPGADVVERLVQQLAAFNRWLAARPPVWDDIEQDIVVLLPPKREFAMTVNIVYAGRALPLVSLDDILVLADND